LERNKSQNGRTLSKDLKIIFNKENGKGGIRLREIKYKTAKDIIEFVDTKNTSMDFSKAVIKAIKIIQKNLKII
jgi:hypothetical protein